MTTGRLPLAHHIQSRTASTAKDSRLVNAVKEDDRIVKRPGVIASNLTPAIASGLGQGLFSWNKYIVAVNNNVVSLVAGNTTSNPTGVALAGALSPISFAQMANDKYLVFHNGANIYSLQKDSNILESPLSGIGVKSVTIDNSGGYYSTAPGITFSAGIGETAATGHTVLFNHQVSSIIVDTPGVYTSNNIPQVSITAPPAGVTSVQSGITLTPINPGVAGASGPHKVTAATCTVGLGYVVAPGITFSGTTPALGYTVINSSGSITNIVISYGGSYPFGTTPTFTITPPPVQTATATASMSNTIQGPYASGLAYLNGTLYALQADVTTQTATSTVTIDISTPNGVTITQVGHGLVADTQVTFTTTGALPTGIISGTPYFLVAPITPDTYSISTVKGGAPVQTSGTQSGVHTAAYTYTTNSRIYGSNLEDPRTWNALNYVTAGSDPDPSVAICRHLNYIVVFGQWSTEFFYDGGSASYPRSMLVANQSAKSEIGCAVGTSVSQLEQTVIWVGQAVTEGRAVYLLNGMSPQKISDRYIDKYLNADPMIDVRSYTFKYAGHTLYVLTLLASNLTFVYDLDEKMWYQWTSQAGGTEGYFKLTNFTSNVEYQQDGAVLTFQDHLTGQLFQMSENHYNDAGNAIYFRAVSPVIDNGSVKRKFYTSVEVVGDKVLGTLSIRHTSDDYNTWSNYRTVYLKDKRPILYQCGEARRRAWEVFSSDSVPIRLEGLELNFDIGEQGMGAE